MVGGAQAGKPHKGLSNLKLQCRILAMVPTSILARRGPAWDIRQQAVLCHSLRASSLYIPPLLELTTQKQLVPLMRLGRLHTCFHKRKGTRADSQDGGPKTSILAEDQPSRATAAGTHTAHTDKTEVVVTDGLVEAVVVAVEVHAHPALTLASRGWWRLLLAKSLVPVDSWWWFR